MAKRIDFRTIPFVVRTNPDGSMTLIGGVLEIDLPSTDSWPAEQATEVDTLEAFLDSLVSVVTFSTDARENNKMIIAFQRILFAKEAQEAHGERPQGSKWAADWDLKAKKIYEPLWLRLKVREILGISLDDVHSHGKAQMQEAMRGWLAEVNARFNAKLEFGQKP